ncbi:MAG TPA: TPM domain-containing protein [Bacteroidales bacterium]|nr:TPM domain-containing protein [Bacteroidales bacterium]HPI67630.1 TPM domain-containing protein [Bacteroidales bacterium]
MKASTFFTRDQQALIRNAIISAEENTSGEVRVHIETDMAGDVLDRAAWIFRKIGMHKTNDRNGVLFYLALNKREFAVIADAGINARVSEGFWDEIKELLAKNFSENKFTEGLIEGILMTGTKLKEYFPRQKDDINELPDDITFDDTFKTAVE